MPLTWLTLGLLIGAWRSRGAARRGWLTLLGLLLLLSNTVLCHTLLGWWERPPVPLAHLAGPYDVVIVLGGATDPLREPRDRVYTGQAADRMLHAVHLYHAGFARQVLLSGGGGDIAGRRFAEAEDMARLLRLCGVPDTSLLLEATSLNTHENAIHSAALLGERFPEGKFLLVTSAFHMRRAEACFRRAGVTVTGFPADFRAKDPWQQTPDQWVLPSAEALSLWTLLLHEVTGYLVYRLRGYA